MKRVLIAILLCATMSCVELSAQAPVKKGYESSIDLGVQICSGNYYSFAPTVSYVGGYRAGEALFIGLGVGASYTTGSNFPQVENSFGEYGFYINHHTIDDPAVALPTPKLSLPVFLQMRAFITDSTIRPFFTLSLGTRISGKHTIGIYEDTFSEQINIFEYKTLGLFAEPMFGVNFNLSRKLGLNISAGVLLHTHPYLEKYSNSQGLIKQHLNLSYTAKIGLSF